MLNHISMPKLLEKFTLIIRLWPQGSFYSCFWMLSKFGGLQLTIELANLPRIRHTFWNFVELRYCLLINVILNEEGSWLWKNSKTSLLSPLDKVQGGSFNSRIMPMLVDAVTITRRRLSIGFPQHWQVYFLDFDILTIFHCFPSWLEYKPAGPHKGG